MLPIIIDPKFVKVLVCGSGYATKKRLEMLESAGVGSVKHLASEPRVEDLKNINIAYIADFDDETSERIAKLIRDNNIILNTEDKKKFCDFHVPSIVRRKDLLITISTAGKSPRVSKLLRAIFSNMFSEKWSDALDEIGDKREVWKSLGDSYKELSAKTDDYLEANDLFSGFCDKCRKVKPD